MVWIAIAVPAGLAAICGVAARRYSGSLRNDLNLAAGAFSAVAVILFSLSLAI